MNYEIEFWSLLLRLSLLTAVILIIIQFPSPLVVYSMAFHNFFRAEKVLLNCFQLTTLDQGILIYLFSPPRVGLKQKGGLTYFSNFNGPPLQNKEENMGK